MYQSGIEGLMTKATALVSALIQHKLIDESFGLFSNSEIFCKKKPKSIVKHLLSSAEKIRV